MVLSWGNRLSNAQSSRKYDDRLMGIFSKFNAFIQSSYIYTYLHG